MAEVIWRPSSRSGIINLCDIGSIDAKAVLGVLQVLASFRHIENIISDAIKLRYSIYLNYVQSNNRNASVRFTLGSPVRAENINFSYLIMRAP